MRNFASLKRGFQSIPAGAAANTIGLRLSSSFGLAPFLALLPLFGIVPLTFGADATPAVAARAPLVEPSLRPAVSSPLLPALPYLAIEPKSETESRRETESRKAWTRSLIPLVASQALDSASSYGMRELNPVLAERNGGFGAGATIVKFAAVGVFAGGEYLLVRKYPQSAKLFTKLNWTAAAVTTGLAIHNFAIR